MLSSLILLNVVRKTVFEICPDFKKAPFRHLFPWFFPSELARNGSELEQLLSRKVLRFYLPVLGLQVWVTTSFFFFLRHVSCSLSWPLNSTSIYHNTQLKRLGISKKNLSFKKNL